jgi:type IV pilus assembly protein PilB
LGDNLTVAQKSQAALATSASAAAGIPSTITGVARVLVQGGVIDDKLALMLAAKAITDKVSFMEALSKNSRTNSRHAAIQLAKTFDLAYIDLECIDQEKMPMATMFDRKKIEELRTIPVYIRGTKIYLATSDPTSNDGMEYFAHKSGKKLEMLVVDEAQIISYFAGTSANGGSSSAKRTELEVDDDALNFELVDSTADEVDAGPVIDDTGEESPIVKLVKGVLLTAIKKGSSDIHFEPFEKFYRIRFRTDGELHEVSRPPVSYGPYIASRIKVLSSLNIAKRMVPQDGRMRLVLPGGRAIDFRVSTLPTLYGEKIVMRILDPSAATLGIDALGYEAEQKEALLFAIGRPDGMVLVTGPTGSGKTVSLYTALNILNTEDVNISTAEDPAEIQLAGINQVNVNPEQGLTFAAALKSFLRQDPDIIMVGEIRDAETAEISCKAAQTGHLVLATLHTNDAPKTVSRLIEIGVKPYVVASSVICITAQRLIRRLCSHCKKDHDVLPQSLIEAGMSEAEVKEMGKSWKPKMPNPEGCEMCTKGYKGRVGVYQVMPISEKIQDIIAKGGDAGLIAAQAKEDGVKDLRQSGLFKYRLGMTSLEEVVGATNL